MPDILISTGVLPPIPVSLASSGGDGRPSLLLRILKPRIQVFGPNGVALVDEAPAGLPGETWPIYTFGALVVGALIIALAIRGASK